MPTSGPPIQTNPLVEFKGALAGVTAWMKSGVKTPHKLSQLMATHAATLPELVKKALEAIRSVEEKEKEFAEKEKELETLKAGYNAKLEELKKKEEELKMREEEVKRGEDP